METVTWAIELGVGIACLVVGAAAVIRSGRRRLIGVAFLTAGLAAAGHAAVQLL